MSEMIERVAWAIYRAFEDRPRYATLQMNGRLAEELARAAIEGMRNPTIKMLWCYELPNISPYEIEVLWRAMIDAALAPVKQEAGE